MLGCGYLTLLIPTLFLALLFGLMAMSDKPADPAKDKVPAKGTTAK